MRESDPMREGMTIEKAGKSPGLYHATPPFSFLREQWEIWDALVSRFETDTYSSTSARDFHTIPFSFL